MNFEEIIKKYKDVVFRMVYMHIGDFHKSEDITQEIFIKIYKNLNKFRGESSVYTWIYKIAINTIRTHVSKDKEIYVDYFEDMADDTWDDGKFLERIEKANIINLIQRLPGKYREVLVLYYYKDLKVEEICYILDEPSGTVKSKLHRGRNMLKSMLLKEGVFGG